MDWLSWNQLSNGEKIALATLVVTILIGVVPCVRFVYRRLRGVRTSDAAVTSTSFNAEDQGIAAGTITTGGGSVVGARDVTQGIPAEQLPAILDANARPWERLADDQRARIADLEEKLGVGERAVRAFFRVLDEAAVPLEEREARLLAIAEDYKRALAESEPAEGDAPEIAELKAKARRALEAGELEHADQLLERVQAAEDAELDRRRLEAAATRAQRGDLAMARLRYTDAARHFAAAAERTPASEEATALGHLDREAHALYRRGEEFGDNQPLADAIARYRALLHRRPRERVPLQWARTQGNLGAALQALGEREGDTTRLGEAVAAYRNALEEFTRERVPLDWAMTQMNLGNALFRLGERERGTQRLEEAVAAYRQALEERTRERVPLDWAMTQNNLGSALEALGERESGTERLEAAVAAYRQALEEFSRDRVPLDWAATQSNLGNALKALGEREGDTDRLEAAVAAYRRALEERTRERVPLQWARTEMNLGAALQALGERESGTERLEEAVAAYRHALEERTRERAPLDWARTQMNLGVALARLGEREGDTARLEEAVVAFRRALEERTRHRVPLDWARTQGNLGAALQVLGERESGTARLEAAVAAFRAALEVFEAGGADHDAQGARASLARAEALVAARRGG